jgi:hypothetical protein
MTNYFRKPDALVDAVNAVLSGQPVQEKMDPVDQKALKGKHSDRKDKDIDNDGDVDSSDEYLHKRRKAVSKAMKEGVEEGVRPNLHWKFDNDKYIETWNTQRSTKPHLGIVPAYILKTTKGKFKVVRDNRPYGQMDGYDDIESARKFLKRHPLTKFKEETEDNPANTQHLCAKNVVHESWGEGSCIPTMHADPDEEGNVAWYDVMFDHGIEEQVSIEELKVTKAESHIHSSKKKIKESDDDDDDDMEDDEDDSDEDEENGKKKKVSGKKDDVDVEPEMDDTKMVTEKEMTPAQEKKREEIVLSMKKEMPRFKKKYGDRAKDVMYATATKMAMKEGFELGIEKSDLIEEVELDEAKVTKKMIDDLEDRNEHGMVALKLAQAYGTAAEVKKVQDINKRHNQRGHIEHKDQKERDVIIRKYYKMAEETELDEAKLSASQIAALKKAYEPMRGKKISMDSGNKLRSIMDKVDDDKEALSQLVKADIPFVSQLAITRLITNHGMKGAEIRKMQEEVELDEAKSGTGYDLYHKDFSSAMQHAYDHAKKKHGITINPSEIDNKVASGPRKPSEGKTNTYRLKGDKGAIQVQVYNKGGSKPFELNMYKEEVELDEKVAAYDKNGKVVGLYRNMADAKRLKPNHT